MYWEKDIETLGRDSLNKLIIDRFNHALERASKSLFYTKRLNEVAIKPGNIKNFKDISNIPFTTKQDLRDNFPYGLLTMPLDNVIRMHSSSGTTGNPTVIFHNQNDINQWSNLLARSLYMAGVRKSDIFQNIMGYGLFTGGLGFHYGAEKLGSLVIPIATGNSDRQLWFMKEFKTTVVHFLPSYALRLHMHFNDQNIKPEDLHLKIACIGAEPHTEETRKKIEELYKIMAYNSYGLSEMNGPGVAFECEYQNGMHLWEDNYYMEIINPDTGEVLPDGEEGELVLTTLMREAMPILRYRTRDLTRIISEPCKCGRTHRRIDRIKGRTDDMLIINGVNIFPMQIEKKLMSISEVGHNYLIEIRKDNFLDKISITVEISNEHFKPNENQSLHHKITELLKNEIGVNPIVNLVASGSLPEFQGKADRVKDLRLIN
ncbi:MAG: phenylacetate--CoA ligase [Spirochaetes bacterium GWF1_31_7]|nr:MAG: phenylacetate--CoA ligase [Spirochaetes bacterium GWE1_32_154]OHD49993.1 MAG: phenylacetate--CoA ligase [Spirochaetes bacterium GWE2_31_10]OHD52309.1 MAG: phenylacetate--CoA ligase [Spirochaetes bacterium GWF1_31_7]HBD95276.1 phenylacetate--CoA ligase [Spirochaetia bacterium]HBI38457.1 phenylacetate--CoA ligase [Spirochaetia bacterium]